MKNPISLAIALFATLTLTSTITAVNPSFALWSNFERGEGAWHILHYCMLFWLLTILFRTENDWKRLIGWQSGVSALVALYAACQAIRWPSWIINSSGIGGALSGTLGNPSYLGGYLLFSALLTLWLAFHTPKTDLKRIIWFVISACETLIFFMARTRGAFGALGAGTIIALFVWGLQTKKGKKHTVALAACAIIVTLATSWLVLTVKGDAIKSFQPRLWTWGSAASGIIERPLTGWGTENFPFIFDKYYNANHYGIQSWFDRAHNAFLEYAASGGIPLAAAYGAIFAVAYLTLMRRKHDAWLPFFMALPAMYLVNGLVLFEILPLYITLFFMLALISRYADGFATEAAERKAKRLPGAHALAVMAACCAGLSIYATIWLPLQKNRLMIAALRTNGKTDTQAFADHEAALAFRSPVGDEEAIQNLYSFTVNYFDFLRQNDLTKQVPPAKIASVMANEKKWHDLIAPQAIGLKGEYAYIASLLVASEATGNGKYLAEADLLTAAAETAAPTRIEFIQLRMAIAAMKKDEKAYAAAREKGMKLRPDLAWEPAMAKYRY